MCALYSFLRLSDDIADGDGDISLRRRRLDAWRTQLDDALRGVYAHRIHAALHHTVEAFGVPREYLTDALDGVAMDLDKSRYATFDELYRYCYRVAGVVGLMCIHVWGFHGCEAKRFAESAGIAFQLTNILRDLREDVERDRIYLPTEDLARFGYGEDELRSGARTPAFAELMRFEAERAGGYYDAAAPLTPLLDRPGRCVFLVMQRTYRGLLDEIGRRGFDVFSRRVRVSRTYKLWQVARVLPVRWGLVG